MKFYSLLIFLFLYINSLVNAQSDLLFQDDFADNTYDWWVTDETSAGAPFFASIYDGKYSLNHRASQSSALLFHRINLDPARDFSVEYNLTQVTGVTNYGFGIVWGGRDNDNLHSFCINSDGKVRIQTKEKGVFKILKDWEKIGAVNPTGVHNILKLEQKGANLLFYVNEQNVFTCPRVKFFGNRLGFEANMQMKVLIDKITVRQETLPIDLLPTQNDYKKINLGELINTKEVEKCPLISPDGNVLYFAREHHPENVGGVRAKDDIWFSVVSTDGEWRTALNPGTPLNNEGANTVISITPDNNTMLLQNTYRADGSLKGMGFSISHRDTTGWSIPKDVIIEDFYNRSSETEAYLSTNKQFLLVTLNRDDSYGDKDIYVCFQQANGRWSKPKNLGNMVNTYADEVSPFLAADNKTLYFSTAGRSGYGSNDIFVTRRLDETWTKWSTPKNLGPSVNTSDWDAYYTLPASGDYAIMCTEAKSIGKLDIFKIKVEEDAKPKPVVLIYGKVLNAKTKQPLDAIISYESLEKGEEVGTASSDPSSGEYKVVLPFGVNYGYHAQVKGYIPVSENIELETIDKYTEINKDLYLVPIEVGQAIPLNNIFFIQAQFNLLPKSFPELDRLVTILEQYPTMEITIEGHTDNHGSEELNVKLSESRALAVKSYLVSKGIKAERIKSIGYGGSRPIADNRGEQTRKLNRRVEFRITKF